MSKFGSDTSTYFKYNFYENGGKYIGKRFNVLLENIETPIKSCLIIFHKFKTQKQWTGLEVGLFYSSSQAVKQGLRKPDITVRFKGPILQSLIDSARTIKGTWTKREVELFKNQIIKSMAVAVVKRQ
ncbi:MAG: hypothetical protein H7Y13_11475 [Sphingobacteriaceae bacterium]|nr:hypothetical protein [Sphingobacteriaceae bacterium]